MAAFYPRNLQGMRYEVCFTLGCTPDRMPVGRVPECGLEGTVTSYVCHWNEDLLPRDDNWISTVCSMHSENKLIWLIALFRIAKCGFACSCRRLDKFYFWKSKISDLLSFVLGSSEMLRFYRNKVCMHSKALSSCLSISLFAIYYSIKTGRSWIAKN